MNMRFYPGVLAGRIRIPSSKSLTHRALIAASLSCGTSVLHHPLYCDDTLATIDCLRKLGVNIKTQRDHLIVESSGRYTYHEMIDVKESATTFRLLVCAISLFVPAFTIACDARLIERLRTRDIDSLQGLTFEWEPDRVHITGSLQPTLYHVSTTITTQWASGLALAMPLGAHYIEAKATDSDYVALSVNMMKQFGVDLIREGDYYKTVGTYQPTELEIEVDYSSSAFFVGMMVFNPQLRIEGIGTSSLQPDFRIFEYLECMGVEFHHYTRVMKVSGVRFQSCTIDLSQNPDLAPILAAVAAVSGKTYRPNRTGKTGI
jgi:3-phosphoshikimate 1-carboxyvinyltransferase